MLLGQGPESSGLAPFTWESVHPVGAENPVTSSLAGETGKEMEQPRPVEPTGLPELEARQGILSGTVPLGMEAAGGKQPSGWARGGWFPQAALQGRLGEHLAFHLSESAAPATVSSRPQPGA